MSKKISILWALIVISHLAFAQEQIVDKIGAGLKKYTEEFPQEKVYLHTDHPYYLAGETIWFKAYVTAGSFHQLSPISSTLYVELINIKKEKVHQSIIHIIEGTGHGDILLPADLMSGNYLLRSYTNWMRNFDEQFFFEKEIKVWNLDEKLVNQPLANQSIDLQFFPEGGNLIAGIKSNLAFKAVGPNGLGKEVKGKILSGKGETIAEFKSTHLGMGSVSILPVLGETYSAIIENEGTQKYALPKVYETGFVISVTNRPDQAEVIMKIQSNAATTNKQVVTLVAHNRGELSFAAQINLSNNLFIAKIPKVKLYHGLAHLTLFDGAGTPQCNRLVFVDKDEKLTVRLNGLKEKYLPREKVNLEIETLNKAGEPVSTNISLAVTNNQEIVSSPNEINLTNYLWLTSDLRGHIEDPNYYFNATKPDRYAALDLLLLTQGWSRFQWDKIMSNDWPVISHYIEQGINVQGSLIDNLTKKPVEGGKVTYVSTDNAADIKVAPTGNEGRFILDDLVFYDSSNVVLQGETKKGKKFVEFKLDEIFPNQIVNTALKPLSGDLSTFEKEMFEKGKQRREIDLAYNFDGKTIVLDAVEIQSKKIDASIQDTRIYAGATKTVKAASVPGSAYLNHPLELLRGVPGVRLTPNPPGYDVLIRGVGSFLSSGTPYILLNNVPIAIESLNAMPASMMESVDVYKGADATIFGAQGANGVIAFFTKKGGYVPVGREGVFSFQLGGYTTPQEFYSPKYDVVKSEHVKPDRRVTVYWKPLIQTDQNGKASISFFNPDPESTFDITIEGMTKTGLTASSKFNYTIKKQAD